MNREFSMENKGPAIKEKPVSYRLLASIICMPILYELDGVFYG
jgi:hypothetical protein